MSDLKLELVNGIPTYVSKVILNKKEYGKKYYIDNKKKFQEYMILYNISHKKEKNEQRKFYRKFYRKKIKEYNRIHNYNLKIETILAISHGTNKCMWEGCGEDRIDGLTVDHIHGGGTKHKKEVRNFYLWLKQNNYPTDEYQVLCANHQMEKVIINGENQHIKNPTPEQQKKRDIYRIKNENLKFQTLSAYSNSPIPFCNVCHTTNIYHLCLDHIHGDGAEDRREKGGGGTTLYRKLKQLNYPDKDKYQVMCYTCNQIKRINNDENRKIKNI